MATVLVIDDDRTVHHLIRRAFEKLDVEIRVASEAEEGLECVKEHSPDVVLLDVVLPNASGLEVFQRIRKIDSKLPIIFITVTGGSDTAIEAMKVGAYDFLVKPLDLNQVRELVRKAIEVRRSMRVPVTFAEDDQPAGGSDLLIGRSPQMLNVYKEIGRVSSQDVTVLIRGESGTGKELIARAIYQHSNRNQGPFLAVNCAAIPDSLLESELFGHEKGAFTGADSRRIGKFEQCSGGTILLDEIGDMPLLLQGKILRLLQEQRFERVGGNQTIQTDVRIIAATNRDLEKMSTKGQFRNDLYYRLNDFTINLPPLRDREGDIQSLVEHFVNIYRREFKKDLRGLSPEMLELLVNYDWPGNIRELQSVIKRACLQATGTVLLPEHLPANLTSPISSMSSEQSAEGELGSFVEKRLRDGSENIYEEVTNLMEREVLTRVLRFTEGNQSKAAKLLGINRGSLRYKLAALGITIQQVVGDGEIDEDA